MALNPQDFLTSLSNMGSIPTQGSTPNAANPLTPGEMQDNQPGAGFGGYDFSSLQGFGDALMGGKDTPGILGLGMDLYTGWKQLNNMEEQLGLNRDKFESDQGFQKTNLANQAQAYNTNLADRQKARLSSGGNYESLKSYTDKNKVRGTV